MVDGMIGVENKMEKAKVKYQQRQFNREFQDEVGTKEKPEGTKIVNLSVFNK